MSGRAEPYRMKPPDGWDRLVEAMEEQRLLLVQTSGPTSFVVGVGAAAAALHTRCVPNNNPPPYTQVRTVDSETTYKVSIGVLQQCSCRADAAACAGGLCVHISFVMLKVLRVPVGNPLAWQKSLLDPEINNILQGRTQRQERQLQRRTNYLRRGAKAARSAAEDDASAVDRAEIGPEDVCPICQCDLHEEGADGETAESYANLEYCRTGCGNNMHIQCMRMYCEHRLSSAGPMSRAPKSVPCPLCRTPWPQNVLGRLRKADEERKPKKAKRKLQSVRCLRCRIVIRSKFYRCLHCAPIFNRAGKPGSNGMVTALGVEESLSAVSLCTTSASAAALAGAAAAARAAGPAAKDDATGSSCEADARQGGEREGRPHDLCKRCFQTETSRSGGHNPDHLWVASNAAVEPVQWEAAVQARKANRFEVPSAVRAAMQGRELTTQDLALLLELERRDTLPNLHTHLVQSLEPANRQDTVKAKIMRQRFRHRMMREGRRADHLLQDHLRALDSGSDAEGASASGDNDEGAFVDNCGLCAGPLSREPNLRRTPCDHVVHESCLVDAILESLGSDDPLSSIKCKCCSKSIFGVLNRHSNKPRRPRPQKEASDAQDGAGPAAQVRAITATVSGMPLCPTAGVGRLQLTGSGLGGRDGDGTALETQAPRAAARLASGRRTRSSSAPVANAASNGASLGGSLQVNGRQGAAEQGTQRRGRLHRAGVAYLANRARRRSPSPATHDEGGLEVRSQGGAGALRDAALAQLIESTPLRSQAQRIEAVAQDGVQSEAGMELAMRLASMPQGDHRGHVSTEDLSVIGEMRQLGTGASMQVRSRPTGLATGLGFGVAMPRRRHGGTRHRGLALSARRQPALPPPMLARRAVPAAQGPDAGA